MDAEIRSLLKGLKWQFIVAFMDWLCDEIIGCIFVLFTPAEAAEMLQLIASEGCTMRQEGMCDADDKVALERYRSISAKFLSALHDAGFGVNITLLGDDEPDDDGSGERLSKEDRQ